MSPVTHFGSEARLEGIFEGADSPVVEYSITHRALLTVARKHKLAGTDIRILLIAGELGEEATHHHIERVGRVDAPMVSRSLQKLLTAGFLHPTRVGESVRVNHRGFKIIAGFTKTRAETKGR
jgi:hypothetical protein